MDFLDFCRPTLQQLAQRSTGPAAPTELRCKSTRTLFALILRPSATKSTSIRIRLDQYAALIHPAEQLLKHLALVGFARVVSGLGHRHSQRPGIDGELSDKPLAADRGFKSRTGLGLPNRYAEAQGLRTPTGRKTRHHLGSEQASSPGAPGRTLACGPC